MPLVHIYVTEEGGDNNTGPTDAQKAELISGVTALLQNVLNKSPTTTHVLISEMPLANWGVGGLPVVQYRQENQQPGTT